jgi:signal transduction histidine kinase/CheY-like chemotaxis protein
MKARRGYYIWILSLTVALMLLILGAQVLTIRNINGLKKGNQEAAVTFTINNRLQQIVNTSATLQTRLLKQKTDTANIKAIKDSLAVMGYNASVLEKLNVDTATKINFVKLNALVNNQVSLSFKILDEVVAANESIKKTYVEEMNGKNLGDSIYQTAIDIEKGLEAKLKKTFEQNTIASQKISTLNKLFALVAIAAILILGTIIINRHLRQVSLIKALELANEEVKKSAMIKEQFLANMSHEIRTPLNAIKGFSRLIQETPLNEEQQKFSEIIEQSSNNLLSLVNDILDISKIEAGKMEVEQKEFDLKRMLQTMELMFMNTAKEKLLNFNWIIDDEVPKFLKGDPDRIYQILVNLVSNAFKFTNEGNVTVSVGRVAENEKEFTLLFKVADTGVGIPAAKQEIIFERFQQISNADESIQKGTGLGLAIVKNLSLLLGGFVTVKSTAGEGAVFTVTLPFPKNDKEEYIYADTNINERSDVIFKGAKILVAEDNEVNQLLISRFLKHYDINPVIADNGKDALELLKIEIFDLLLLDIQMPVLDGYKTSVAIRETGNAIPIIAMTAYVMEAEKEKCRTAGMNDYLAKPLDEAELRKVLIKYLEKFIISPEALTTSTSNTFLLQLAGGDRQMAEAILISVKQQIPIDIEKLKLAVDGKDINALPGICHNIISSISPLGNNSAAMQQIGQLQRMLAENKDENYLLAKARALTSELEKIHDMLTTIKQV